jgi:hypothetical protein
MHMPEYHFNPHTGEHIETATPADWMGSTSIAPPAYDRATQSAFFRGGAWEVETAQPPTAEQIIAQYTAAVQKHLDDFARTRGYDGILSAATYATSTVPKFKAEGQYAVEARDATWAKCYEVLAAVEAGSRPMPTLGELLAELPVLTWPN